VQRGGGGIEEGNGGNSIIHEVKVNFALEQDMKTEKGIELQLYSFFILGATWEWVVGTGIKNWYLPTVQEDGQRPGPVLTRTKEKLILVALTRVVGKLVDDSHDAGHIHWVISHCRQGLQHQAANHLSADRHKTFRHHMLVHVYPAGPTAGPYKTYNWCP
jgi:hypothetical protein